ncbi:aminoacyl-tRNA hydrolase [Patescibacteria group bacterium]|nr:aminoacyl-tRNA hydrolase [Patescibacteria group bacterium]
MILIVGLGNPGQKYEHSRHNVGFRVLDEMVKDPQIIPVNQAELKLEENKKFKAEMAEANLHSEKLLLVKPTTFMNNSGSAVAAIANFYKIEPQNIWVISDDLDICTGIIRTRHGDSSGGHKGLEDIIQKLGDSNFARIRVGIAPTSGDPNRCEKLSSDLDANEYVLEDFTKREEAIIKSAISKAAIYIIESAKINNLIATTIDIK